MDAAQWRFCDYAFLHEEKKKSWPEEIFWFMLDRVGIMTMMREDFGLAADAGSTLADD